MATMSATMAMMPVVPLASTPFPTGGILLAGGVVGESGACGVIARSPRS